MFANLGAFIHGNMFAGLFGPAVGVRLSPADQGELAAAPGSGPFGPAAWRDTPEVAVGWVERAFTYVSAQPPKIKKPRKIGEINHPSPVIPSQAERARHDRAGAAPERGA